MPASKRTLFRFLDVCSASMQESLHGLDYFISEGVQGCEFLEEIAGTLRNKQAVTSSWEKDTKQQLSNAKRYLKADYKLHVSKDERCIDHCAVHALSSPTVPLFKANCDHVHNIICDACSGLEAVVGEIGAGLDDGTKRKLQFEYDKAKEAIGAWKAHNMRIVNQDLAKQDVLNKLNGNNCLIVMDWAMKFLPLRYKEQMKNSFGKRGKSWHVSHVIEKQEERFSVQCFTHLFEHSKQVFFRSDNGACYHNAPLLFALPAVGSRTRIQIRRYDFSEPQAGKDICDRKIAPMKVHIRRYVNERHDVVTAADLKEAL